MLRLIVTSRITISAVVKVGENMATIYNSNKIYLATPTNHALQGGSTKTVTTSLSNQNGDFGSGSFSVVGFNNISVLTTITQIQFYLGLNVGGSSLKIYPHFNLRINNNSNLNIFLSGESQGSSPKSGSLNVSIPCPSLTALDLTQADYTSNALFSQTSTFGPLYIIYSYTAGRYIYIYNNYSNSTEYETYSVYDKNNFTVSKVGTKDTNNLGYKIAGVTEDAAGTGTLKTSISGDIYDQTYYYQWTKLYRVYFYNETGSLLTDDNKNKEVGNSVTVPSDRSMVGYIFRGWTRTPDSGKDYKIIYGNTIYSVPAIADSQINGSATSDGFEIKYYPVFQKKYQIIFNKVLSNATFSYTQSNYNNKIVGNTVTTPTTPTINTHKFIGWARDSSITANTAVLSGSDQNCWTTIPAVADSQVNGEATTNGFEIIYYAVWQERDSVTISATPSGIITPSNVSFTNTPDASDGLTYYFNIGTNISRQCTISISSLPTASNGEGFYYIYSVTGATGAITAVGQRSWTGNNVTNTSTTTATSKTIEVTLKRNLRFYFHSDVIEVDTNGITGPYPNNWKNDNILSASDSNRIHESSWITTGSSGYCENCIQVYLNPGDSMTFTSTCTNQDYYLARIHVPNSTNTMDTPWGGSYSGNTKTITNTNAIDRSVLKSNGGYSGNRVSASFLSTDTKYKNCTYTLTIPTGNDGIALMGVDDSTHKIQRAYLVYEPFHCQVQLTNTDYDPYVTRVGSLYTKDDCLLTYTNSNQTRIYRFFNDIELTSGDYITCKRTDNDTNNIITTVSYNDNVYNIEYPTLWFGTNKIHNLYYFPSAQQWTFGPSDYYTNHFSELRIQPDQSLLDEYHAPYILNVAWNNTIYRCFMILRLPEAGEDANTTETDSSNISSKINRDFSGWANINKSGQNRLVYYKDFNTLTESINNIEISDASNSGYILKNIQRYRYNSAYNSTINNTTNPPTIVTREELDSGVKNLSTVLPGWNRSSSATSNDVLTFNQNTLPAGVVDYYFITYEEGLPIFYPDGENNPKRAIQLYWEGNRAIGLYYENTRLL